jgi:hypothetical protein
MNPQEFMGQIPTAEAGLLLWESWAFNHKGHKDKTQSYTEINLVSSVKVLVNLSG